MKLEKAVKKLLDHIGSGEVSNDLIDIHNHVCHSSNCDIDQATQLKLWSVLETAKAIKTIEKSLKKQSSKN